MTDHIDLIIPVYLNQRIVFDLLAMLEGGISHVTRVASIQQKTEAEEQKYGASFGLSKALSSLFSINVSGGRQKSGESTEACQSDEERIHTPASLFFRLRQQMIQRKLVSISNGAAIPSISDWIEFGATMTPNPVVNLMDTTLSVLDIFEPFADQAKSGKSHQKQPSFPSKNQMQSQMKVLRESFTAGAAIDLVAKVLNSDRQVLVTLETAYLNDPKMLDLADGTFRVLGKVTRVVSAGEGISLLRKSALAAMPQEAFAKVFGNLAAGVNAPALNSDSFTNTELSGPTFQVIPIAIYA